MLFNPRIRRVAGRTSFGLVMLGAGAAAVAASRPVAVVAAIEAVEQSITCHSASPCWTSSNSSNGLGLEASSAKGTGLVGSGPIYGVKGTSTNHAGVAGTSTFGPGVLGTTPDNIGVEGHTTTGSGGIGVYGVTPNGVGVLGATTSGSGTGVIGQVNGGGVGTYGFSSSGYGLEGISDEGYGVVAQALDEANGIYVSAQNSGYGLSSYTSGGLSLYGNNSSGNGSDITGTYIGMIGRAPASGGFPLVLTDQNSNNVFYVDGAGNVSYSGGLFNFARVKGGGSIKSFSAKTTLPTVEDTGTAELVNGVAQVRLDPTFAATIDGRTGYRVFVTPDGETRGWLFVAAKNSSGFTVREAQAGRSTVTFDYRIVATALGQTGQRMAFVNANGPRATAPVVKRLKVTKPKAPAQQP